MTTTTQDQPTLIGEAPPDLRRDRMVQGWMLGVIVSALGDTVFVLALAWTAVHAFSPAMAGLVVGIEMLPQALLMLIGGVLADRMDTRKVMLAGQVTRVVVLVAGATLWQSGIHEAWLLMSVALAFGITSGLTQPAGATLSRQLVRADDLSTVIGWSQIGGRLARLAGAPVAALALAHGGLVTAMLVDAVSFAAIALIFVLVVRPRFRLPRTVGEPWQASLKGGLGYLARTPVARTFVLGLCSLNVFIGPVIAIGVALRVAESDWGSGWYGLAEAAFAVGAIGGSVAGIRWQGTFLARRGFWTLVVQGVGIAAVGMPARASVVGGMLLVGVTAGLASVWLSGTFQRVIAPSHLGRVSSVSQLGDLTLAPVMLPAFGALAAATSILTATVVYGAAMSALCAWLATRHAIATLR